MDAKNIKSVVRVIAHRRVEPGAENNFTTIYPIDAAYLRFLARKLTAGDHLYQTPSPSFD
jgi:hypothetical protein